MRPPLSWLTSTTNNHQIEFSKERTTRGYMRPPLSWLTSTTNNHQIEFSKERTTRGFPPAVTCGRHCRGLHQQRITTKSSFQKRKFISAQSLSGGRQGGKFNPDAEFALDLNQHKKRNSIQRNQVKTLSTGLEYSPGIHSDRRLLEPRIRQNDIPRRLGKTADAHH